MPGSRIGGAVAIVMAAALISAGCSASEPDSGGSAPGIDVPVGQRPDRPQVAAMGTGVEITAAGGTALYTLGNLRPVPPDAQIIPARGVMYSVDVTIEARSGTTVYNGFYFVARAADGTTIAPAVGAVRPGIVDGTLGPGQRVAGHIAYDVAGDGAGGSGIAAIMLRDPKGAALAVWSAG